jgi:cysteine desulfurase
MAKAMEIAMREMDERRERESALVDLLITGLMENIPGIRLNGHPTLRLPNNANISVSGVEGESMLLNLDMNGIAVSSGSACSSGALEPSHVLRAIGLPFTLAQASLRFSLGRSNTAEEIRQVVRILPPIVSRLRSISPISD